MWSEVTAISERNADEVLQLSQNKIPNSRVVDLKSSSPLLELRLQRSLPSHEWLCVLPSYLLSSLLIVVLGFVV